MSLRGIRFPSKPDASVPIKWLPKRPAGVCGRAELTHELEIWSNCICRLCQIQTQNVSRELRPWLATGKSRR